MAGHRGRFGVVLVAYATLMAGVAGAAAVNTQRGDARPPQDPAQTPKAPAVTSKENGPARRGTRTCGSWPAFL